MRTILLLATAILLAAACEKQTSAPDAGVSAPDAPRIDAAMQIADAAPACVIPATVDMTPTSQPTGGWEAFFLHTATASASADPECRLSAAIEPGGLPPVLAFFDNLEANVPVRDFSILAPSVSGWRIEATSNGTILASGLSVVELPQAQRITVRLAHAASGRSVEVVFQLAHAAHQLTIHSFRVLT